MPAPARTRAPDGAHVSVWDASGVSCPRPMMLLTSCCVRTVGAHCDPRDGRAAIGHAIGKRRSDRHVDCRCRVSRRRAACARGDRVKTAPTRRTGLSRPSRTRSRPIPLSISCHRRPAYCKAYRDSIHRAEGRRPTGCRVMIELNGKRATRPLLQTTVRGPEKKQFQPPTARAGREAACTVLRRHH